MQTNPDAQVPYIPDDLSLKVQKFYYIALELTGKARIHSIVDFYLYGRYIVDRDRYKLITQVFQVLNFVMSKSIRSAEEVVGANKRLYWCQVTLGDILATRSVGSKALPWTEEAMANAHKNRQA